MVIDALGRDIRTGISSTVDILDTRTLEIKIGNRGHILSAKNDSDLSFLNGLKVGREVRDAKQDRLPQDVARYSLTHRLLEELAPLAFLGRGALFSWEDGIRPAEERSTPTKQSLNRKVEGLCISYQPGSLAMTDEGCSNLDVIHQPFGMPALDGDDPWAWHHLGEYDGPHFLRLRRQDVWLEDDLQVDLAFQDAAKVGRATPIYRIYHEYRIRATIDPQLGRVKDLETSPGTLPFASCLSALPGASSLIRQDLNRLSENVRSSLGGTAGCTHLNSALQTLEDALGLHAYLRGV